MVGDLLQLRDAHEQAQLVLPWRVNGTLDPGEAALLEAHLAECEECRQDLAANFALRELYADLPMASEPARPALLGALEAGAPPPGGSTWRFLRRRVSSGWGRAAQAAVAAAAAVALVLIVAPSERDGDYQLLGSETSEQQGNAIVLFSPDTAERDLRAALDQAGARLVDGPTASGAYIVRVPADQRGAALEGLRALPQVILAEPIDAAGGP
jgi:anti-sigma factor RsiW